MYYLNRLTPLIAGWQRFDFKKFLKIHFGAAVLWTALMMIFSYGLGLLVGPKGLKWLIKKIGLVITILILIFIGGEYILKKLFFQRIQKQLINR